MVFHNDIFWGLLLIFSGVLLFFNSTGIIPWTVWEELWRILPMFIILAGLKVILGNYPVSRFIIGITSIVFIVILMMFVLYLTAPQFLPQLPGQLEFLMQNMESHAINEI